jgi:uncharacterized membrane protein YfcA
MELPAFLSDPETLFIFAVFLFAGFVKGIVGLGLPTLSLGILATVIGLPNAMAILIIPSFSTNVWQGFSGPGTLKITRRLAPMFICAIIMVWVGVAILVRVDTKWLTMLLGTLIAIYGLAGLTSPRMPKVGHRERWLGPLVGGINGTITGLTGAAIVPGVFYLQSLDFDRNAFVKAIGILFSISGLALFSALWFRGRLSIDLGIISVLACIPSFIGMAIGEQVRKRLSEKVFKRVFFVFLILLGIYVFVRSVTG